MSFVHQFIQLEISKSGEKIDFSRFKNPDELLRPIPPFKCSKAYRILQAQIYATYFSETATKFVYISNGTAFGIRTAFLSDTNKDDMRNREFVTQVFDLAFMDVLLVIANIWLPSFLSNASDKDEMRIPHYFLVRNRNSIVNLERHESKSVSSPLLAKEKQSDSKTSSFNSLGGSKSGLDFDDINDKLISKNTHARTASTAGDKTIISNKSNPVIDTKNVESSLAHPFSPTRISYGRGGVINKITKLSDTHETRSSPNFFDSEGNAIEFPSAEKNRVSYGRGGVQTKKQVVSHDNFSEESTLNQAGRVYGRGYGAQTTISETNESKSVSRRSESIDESYSKSTRYSKSGSSIKAEK